MRSQLQKVIDTLDNLLGDTDPDLPDDMTDDEIRQEEPLFWSVTTLNEIMSELLS